MGQMEKEESEEGVLEEESEEEKESEEEEEEEEGEEESETPTSTRKSYRLCRYGGMAMDGHSFVHAYTYSIDKWSFSQRHVFFLSQQPIGYQ